MTGRAIRKALVAGHMEPEELADLARGTLKRKRAQLVEALNGLATAHHQRLLKLHLELIEAIEKAIEDIDAQIGAALEPFRVAAERPKTMPDVSGSVVQVIVSEIGLDMSRFATHEHLLSWAAFCPRADESAGKRSSTRTRKGASWIKTVWRLLQTVWSALSVDRGLLQAD